MLIIKRRILGDLLLISGAFRREMYSGGERGGRWCEKPVRLKCGGGKGHGERTLQLRTVGTSETRLTAVQARNGVLLKGTRCGFGHEITYIRLNEGRSSCGQHCGEQDIRLHDAVTWFGEKVCDPETECENDLGNDVQWLDCTFAKSGSANLTSAFFYIRFTDQFNGEYDTRPIKIDVKAGTGLTAMENANSIQDALEALPNFAIPEIEVDFTVTGLAGHSGSADRPQIRLEFTDGHNTGKQPMVQVFSVADCAAGSQPYFESVVAGGDLTCVVSRATATAKEYKESDTCSNRGICDQSTGLCNCFDGYFGLACDNVNTYI